MVFPISSKVCCLQRVLEIIVVVLLVLECLGVQVVFEGVFQVVLVSVWILHVVGELVIAVQSLEIWVSIYLVSLELLVLLVRVSLVLLSLVSLECGYELLLKRGYLFLYLFFMGIIKTK